MDQRSQMNKKRNKSNHIQRVRRKRINQYQGFPYPTSKDYIKILKMNNTTTKHTRIYRSLQMIFSLHCISVLREYFTYAIYSTHSLGSEPYIVNLSLCEVYLVSFHCLFFFFEIVFLTC